MVNRWTQVHTIQIHMVQVIQVQTRKYTPKYTQYRFIYGRCNTDYRVYKVLLETPMESPPLPPL